MADPGVFSPLSRVASATALCLPHKERFLSFLADTHWRLNHREPLTVGG